VNNPARSVIARHWFKGPMTRLIAEPVHELYSEMIDIWTCEGSATRHIQSFDLDFVTHVDKPKLFNVSNTKERL
jgi:hypothetical protein